MSNDRPTRKQARDLLVELFPNICETLGIECDTSTGALMAVADCILDDAGYDDPRTDFRPTADEQHDSLRDIRLLIAGLKKENAG